MSTFESAPPPSTPESPTPQESAPPRWRSPLERRSADETHNQELSERQQAVNELLSTPLSQTARGKELLHGVAVDTHMELVMREVTEQAPPDLITKYFPQGKESESYREFSGAVDDLLKEPVSPAQRLEEIERAQDLSALSHLKKLSAMTLEKVVPATGGRSWENLSPEEKATVRFAESLNIMSDAAEINIRLAKPELRQSLNEHISEAGIGALRHHYERFKRYSANEDIPERVKKQLEDTRAVLLLTYPDLEQKPAKPVSPRAAGRQAEAAVPRVEQPRESLRRETPATIQKQEFVQRPDAVTASGTPSETKAPTMPGAITPEKRREDEQYVSYTELQGRSTEQMLDYVTTIQNRVQRERANPHYAQAEQILEGLRDGREFTPESKKNFYGILQRYQIADPKREQDRQRYLGILENELGYGAAQVGGFLDQRVSKVTERLYARANVVGGIRGLLSMWSGKADYRVWQARADTLQSMREAAVDPSLNEPMQALLKRYADELELINARDLVERSRYVDQDEAHRTDVKRKQGFFAKFFSRRERQRERHLRDVIKTAAAGRKAERQEPEQTLR